MRKKMKTALSISLLAISLAGTARAQTSIDIIQIDEGRPLAMAVVQLIERYRYLVTYEDVPPDLETETRTTTYAPNAFHKNEIRSRYSSAHPVTFHVPRPSRMQPGKPDALLAVPSEVAKAARGIVEEYNASGNPGRFAVILDGQYTHIVPAARKLHGKFESFEPVLDTRVTIASTNSGTQCLTVLNDLFDRIYQARALKMVLGMVPIGGLIRHQCQVEGANIKARDVLRSILTQIAPPVPGEDPSYCLLYTSPSPRDRQKSRMPSSA